MITLRCCVVVVVVVFSAFLTELRDHGRLSARSPSRVRDSDSQECGTLDLRKLVYPGIRGGRGAVPLPGSLEPLHLLDLVTNTTPLPVR